ncbi:DUF1631 domain-containing protein [Aliikangiella marina]|uniref:DUF1631 domain-containing protein n=1 Tax=Aliikangiella marina TaxID=1712262 RepID=A0A545T2H0_9GAMM|nr:DUF1631 domain-containing protein [Aliikangiella marina]TQV71385.1 DUF1631 domain-containing protein [Aliikangiella marina]
MGKKSHILDFSSKANGDQQKGSQPLPVLVQEARDVCLKDLDKNLRKMFEQADDYLFDMSDSGYNNTHFDAMRLLRLKKDSLIRNFQAELKNSFAENLGSDIHQQEASLGDMSFENIALVEESDLEEGIAIDGMIKKARGVNVDALEKIRTRLDTLIASQTVTKENNPFEPAFVCSSFKKASLSLDIDIESLLVIYKLFERVVLSELTLTYQNVNQFFIDKGVLPELKIKSHQSAYKNTNSTAYQPEQTLSPIDEILESNAVNSQPQGAVNAEGDKVIGLMQSLLAQSRVGGAGNTAQLSSGVVQQIETPQLMSALTDIQSSAASAGNSNANIVMDVRSLIGDQLGTERAKIQNGALGQFNEDMIDIVSMLFDFILDDKNVHSEIKSIIARLQIPMLKVGLVDRSFFSNKKHSARILLNEIARAGISWDPSDKNAQQMLEKIESICDEITENFKDDVSIFNLLLNDFEAFRATIQRRADIFERRTKEAEEGKAKAESARAVVNRTLEKICIDRHVPEAARDILKNVWVNVLFLERLKDTKDGWEKACQVAKLLIWTVQPVASAQGLEKLVSRIPVLVKNLRKGFDVISLSPIDGTRMLEELETTHREIIKKAQEKIENEKQEDILRLQPAPMIPDSHPAEISGDEKDSEADAEKIEMIEIHDIGFAPELTGQVEVNKLPVAELTPESLQAVERLSAGQWVELEIDSEFHRCKLAAKISSSNKFIFVNRSGIKMAEFQAEALAGEYQVGRLKILDEEALFDRALESVISNLRAMKSEV